MCILSLYHDHLFIIYVSIIYLYKYICAHVLELSCPTLVVSWTVAHQAPLPMEFSRQEYGVGCHFLLQDVFPTQGSNFHLYVSCIGRWILLPLCHLGSS